MWDSDARKRAADLIEQFRTAQISNDEFMDNYPTSAKDPAVRPIFWQLWFLWDDLSEHKLEGKHRLSGDQEALMRRCELFLRSSREYTWPPFFTLSSLLHLLRWIPPIGVWCRRMRERWDQSGDPRAWPFICLEDYQREAAKAQP